MLKIILVQGFCPLKIKITQFLAGFCLNHSFLAALGIAGFQCHAIQNRSK